MKNIKIRKPIIGIKPNDLLNKDIDDLTIVSKEYCSKEQAINDGLKSIKRVIKNNQNYILEYKNNMLFFEKIFFNENKQKIKENLIKFKEFECLICNSIYQDKKSLASHIQFSHKISTEQYTIKYIYGGIRPLCKFKGCNNNTRYSTYIFYNYCIEHITEAMSIGGKIGGLAEAWNKGETKYTNLSLLNQSINSTGEGNHFFGKTHSKETVDEISKKKMISEEELNKRIEEYRYNFVFDANYENYKSQDQEVDYFCKTCNEINKIKFRGLRIGFKCKICSPNHFVSNAEIKIGNYVRNLGFEINQSDRTKIGKKELDIYIPDKNIAIEYNGLYWHKIGKFNKNIKRHMIKAELCKEQNIELIQIFCDEYTNKKDIIHNLISDKLNIYKNLIDINNIEICESFHYDEFFETNHILGKSNNVIKAFSLRDIKTKEIFATICLEQPLFEIQTNTIEISRFCHKLNWFNEQSFKLLLEQCIIWCKENGYKTIQGLSDKRLDNGEIYLNNNFIFKENTNLNYWITSPTQRINVCFTENNFDIDPIVEKELYEQDSDLSRIYGCGYSIFQLNL